MSEEMNDYGFEEDGSQPKERRKCPVSHCSSIVALSARITKTGSIALVLFGLFVGTILYLANNTNEIAKESKKEITEFVDAQLSNRVEDAGLRATMVSQMTQHQRQIDKTTQIQESLVKSVTILETKIK